MVEGWEGVWVTHAAPAPPASAAAIRHARLCNIVAHTASPQHSHTNTHPQNSVWGVGEATAERYYERGCRSLDDLRALEGLPELQRVGLRHFDDFEVMRGWWGGVEGAVCVCMRLCVAGRRWWCRCRAMDTHLIRPTPAPFADDAKNDQTNTNAAATNAIGN